MKKLKPSDWSRAIVLPISTMFSQAVSGFGGKTRRKVQILKEALADANTQCDRLRQEMQELVHYTDAELKQMKQERDRAIRERDELHLKVLLLEEELESATHLLDSSLTAEPAARETIMPPPVSALPPTTSAIAPATPESHSPLSTEPSASEDIPASPPESHLPQLDLSEFRLALVGGHPSTRRGVIQELQMHYGLKHFVEIPRMSEANTSRNRVKSKIHRCNLVVLITGYMSHRLTEIVFSLKDAGMLAGDVLQLSCKGKSGVLRGILEHVKSKTT
ncbi:MAG: hypothetical protein F6K30_06155 [Cyanothece sp. SIO2G6]|nr:hypothetical protein [Cyanothece sp. SIO2G6]